MLKAEVASGLAVTRLESTSTPDKSQAALTEADVKTTSRATNRAQLIKELKRFRADQALGANGPPVETARKVLYEV
jgi:hypothetical protein